MIGKTVSHYKILEKLGEGGMGVVYKAEDTKLKRTVALKFLSPQAVGTDLERTRFKHEAQATASLNHPSICTIHEIDEFENQTFIAMEYVEGRNLRDSIKSGPLKVSETIKTAIEVAEGLQEAHEKEIVHRDIKPGNIMVTGKGVAKILDFGLAKLAGMTKVTKKGATVGTAAYMSPEQARGDHVDHRTDIWSLGVVLYEMLTGQLPFKSDYEQALIYSIMHESPKPITAHRTDVPIELERIVTKAMEKDPSRRYQQMEELLVDLKVLRDTTVPGGAGARSRSRTRRRLIAYALALAAVAVVFFVGIKIKIGREPPALAAENKLAVMYFENIAESGDAGRLGEIVTNLLITDLSESRYVQVVSSQRLYDILKLLGSEGVKVIGRELATQVAGKANAKWMLLGSILQVEPQLVVTSQLVEVGSGTVVASQKIAGEVGEAIFSLVDKLTMEVKKDLSLPAAAAKEPDRSVAEVTTNSHEAYRYYIEGVDNLNKVFYLEARKSFENALACDSTMAMAYYQLSWIAGSEGSSDRSKMAEKAVAHANRSSHKEQLLIKARNAWFNGNLDNAITLLHEVLERYPDEKTAHRELGIIYQDYKYNLDKALEHYTKAIEIDSLYQLVYNDLSYFYNALGNFEKAIWASNEYISLTPGDPNPYDTRGDIYASNGKLDLAIESYKKALEIKSNFEGSLEGLGTMYLIKGEYEKAESVYLELCSFGDKRIRSAGRYFLALIPASQGRLNAALESVETGIAADKMEHADKQTYYMAKHVLKLHLLEEAGRLDLAREQAQINMNILRNADVISMSGFYDYAYILARSGMVGEAEQKAAEYKKFVEGNQLYTLEDYWSVLGHIEMAKKRPGSAADCFERSIQIEPEPSFRVFFDLAEAYLAAGKIGKAVDVLERIVSRYVWGSYRDIVSVRKARYLLGIAYERSGWTKKAIAQYEEFLDIWKDADPGLKEVADARERLKRLTGLE